MPTTGFPFPLDVEIVLAASNGRRGLDPIDRDLDHGLRQLVEPGPDDSFKYSYIRSPCPQPDKFMLYSHLEKS